MLDFSVSLTLFVCTFSETSSENLEDVFHLERISWKQRHWTCGSSLVVCAEGAVGDRNGKTLPGDGQ